MQYGIGVDVGGTTVKLGLFQQDGSLVTSWEIPTRTENSGASILPDVALTILGCLEQRGIDKREVFGIGIGVPGPVDEKGLVNQCVNLGWGVFNLSKALSELTGLPVKAGNDATVAALGEHWFGGGKGCDSSLTVTLGTGVGGGLVLGGQVVNGSHGVAGELGHMTVNRAETTPCNCGKFGCLEQYASATGIVRMAHQQLDQSDEPSALRKREDFTCKDVFDCAAEGDAIAQATLERAYAYLGESIANACCVIDPQLVLLGGGVSKAGKPLLDGVYRHFRRCVFHAGSDTRFALATLGNDAGIYGCFCLARNAFLN